MPKLPNLGFLLALFTAVSSMAMWAGKLSGEVGQVRSEYQIVLQEVREMRRELQRFRLEQAELHARWRR